MNMQRFLVTLTKDGLVFSRWIEAESEEIAIRQLLKDYPDWQAVDVRTA